mmetsp:Transcript_17325/g.56703  ORF Transcript_17325/g.56703 Transcript_17325/m.56703 type:complete len:339 (+) Transcript_17325:910-1926(+)
MSGRIRTITRTSRCLGTGPSATTSSARRLCGRGSSSPSASGCPRTGYMPRTLAATRSKAWRLTTRRSKSGSRFFRPAACFRSGARITFGRWGTRDRAGRARRFTLTASAGGARRTWSTMMTRCASRFGTWSSSSTTASQTARSSRSRPSTSTPAWALSACAPSSRTKPPTTIPTFSCPSLKPSRKSLAPSRMGASSATRTRRIETWRTASWLTTSARSASPSRTAPRPETKGATTSCAASFAAPCATGATTSAPSRASSASSCPWCSSCTATSFRRFAPKDSASSTSSWTRKPPSSARSRRASSASPRTRRRRKRRAGRLSAARTPSCCGTPSGFRWT